MKSETFEKQIFIQATVPAVIEVISNYSLHDKIHPLIEKVERAGSSPPGVERFFITDNLKWGPFKFRIKYQADIVSVTQDTVHTEAYQSPNTHVTNISKVIPSGEGVILHETITMQAPDLLFGYAFKQAHAAHEELLKRIKD